MANSNIKLKMMEVNFAGDFTSQELEQYREAFKRYDLDGNGQLELFELHQIYEKQGETKTNAELLQLIRDADQTSKGGIDYGEFLSILLKDKKGLLKGMGGFTKIVTKTHDESKDTGKKANIFEQKAAALAEEKEREAKVRAQASMRKEIASQERQAAVAEKARKEKVAAGLAKLKANINGPK
eukprot:TRINITY_DN658_c0_g2_i1.p1 TRINITY_DN658_c0_g2~~TRINITY_DN658_c0_g2_i1.p1  ORF type:complete len:199 (+),score=67.56 TRINITY_DN658_c0_g2_i1:49-597(+)